MIMVAGLKTPDIEETAETRQSDRLRAIKINGKNTMLSSIPPTFKPVRCKLTELLCNQLLEIAQNSVRTQGAAVCRR